MKEKDLKSMSDKDWEEFYETARIFNELQDDEKEFINWVIDGAAHKRFEIRVELQKLLEMYEQETGVSLERLKD